MDREPVCYEIRRKNASYSDAIAAGFGARRVPAEDERLVPGALHLISGLQFGSLVLLKHAIKAGEPYIFFDRAYVGGGPGSGKLRGTFGAYQQNWIRKTHDHSAFLPPWQDVTKRDTVMFVPPSDAIIELFDMGEWVHNITACLRKTRWQVAISRKGDPVPLQQRLAYCRCVVTWTSNVAVDAIIAGVPAVTASYSAAAPVAGSLNDMEAYIEKPSKPNRAMWYTSLLKGQFTLEGIRSGLAKSVLLEDAKWS